MSAPARAIRAAGACGALAALLVGVPFALIATVGWPLPTVLPAWTTISASLRGGTIPDAVLAKTLACVVWVAWAQLAAAVCWEAAINVPRVSRGRPERRGPRLINRHAGAIAARMVGAVVVISVTTRAAGTTAALPPSLAAVASAPLLSADPARADAPIAVQPTAANSPCWVVHPGETLWGICQRATGGPDQLGEIMALNADQLSRPRDVRAGMVLRLPAGADVPTDRTPPTNPSSAPVPPVDTASRHAQAVRLADVSPPATEHTVEAGDNLWSISAAQLRSPTDPAPPDREIAPYWAQVIAANHTTVPNPDLIYPGQEITLPPAASDRPPPDHAGANVPRPATVVPPATAPPDVSPPATSPPQAAPPAPRPASATQPDAPSGGHPSPHAPATSPAPTSAARADETASGGGFDGWLAPAGIVGASLLATWATIEARRRRNLRLRRARSGSVWPPPDPTIAATTVAIAANTNIQAADRLDRGLRHLASIDARPVPPRPQVVLRHRSGELEAYLATAAPAAADPWTSRAEGRVWALDPHADLPDGLDDVPPPCPGLVQLGVCEDGAELYADLEAFGVIGLAGPPDASRQIARALTATLVVSPAARQCRILTWGYDPYGLEDQAPTRLVVASSPEQVLAEAEATARPVRAALDETPGMASSFRLRAAVPEEGWEPAIVIAGGGPLSPAETATLRDLGGSGGQGAAVILPDADAPFCLRPDEPAGWWRLDPIGVRVRAVGLAAEELRDLAAFLAEADVEPVEPIRDRLNVEAAVLDVREEPTSQPVNGQLLSATAVAERDWRVMVRLLGIVDAVNREGRSATGERDQPLELLAWLVTHRDTATRTGAMEALWGGRRVEARTFTNVVSGTRNLLRSLAGEPPDGGEWIPARRERLVLHRAVVSDYDLLLDRLARARHLDPAAAAEVLAGGAGLMRGAPLGGVEWQWADDQALRSRIAVQAVELAAELARFRLAAGDLRGAAEAGDLGHSVIPFHDECTVLAIQALAGAGDRTAAIARYEDYERQAMARGEAIAPEVARVRNEMLRR